ncbi:Thiol peroxidase [Flavobacterium indicum GPTSA100-9 = DSM 17447]|uniref:Thiol peroxidase n=1 Tax=Flavobacterium indicum (strain DSM 17447 / CIP 109464 / GPTSA100-9) TaxID=1094466 RepID=H8XTS5_FLAIG|nr:thiol peroxidase [Flavobacterium indicum]CCG53655.1 Thiol peroxidase [Flavobacterium indicum GPTSA100-9 = DSM 17447]
MATVTLGGNPTHTNGELPTIGSKAPEFKLVDANLGEITLGSFAGQNVILNIFPSVDTATCATSVRTFNKLASELPNTKVLCISRDLPFAQKRFCGAEGIENVINLSDFRDASFAKDYGVLLTDGALNGLHARAIVVVDANGVVKHTELVSEIANEPNYDNALQAL